ncbi:biotin/lipoyl-binding carrier protein [Mumia zhuanghuii]|uniref:Biotin/lipoyl-binding carrier protein n=2 Tax=Mumia TaxID=1546255 RepID=A0ABW1QN36_9ACTN|nr:MULTISPECIES: biotin/lipoyl-binding carrier protein [Mumia]KAA1422175.1 biotin/lipoyl-binding carrier protein [Mumia zhuanghuii]
MYAARAEIVGNVWRLHAQEGDHVAAGDLVAVLETMKMEIPVLAGESGTVRLHVREGQIVQEGDVIAEIA